MISNPSRQTIIIRYMNNFNIRHFLCGYFLTACYVVRWKQTNGGLSIKAGYEGAMWSVSVHCGKLMLDLCVVLGGSNTCALLVVGKTCCTYVHSPAARLEKILQPVFFIAYTSMGWRQEECKIVAKKLLIRKPSMTRLKKKKKTLFWPAIHVSESKAVWDGCTPSLDSPVPSMPSFSGQ